MFYRKSQPKIVCVCLCVFLLEISEALVLRAYISQHGLSGEIEFVQKNESYISIRTNLKPTLQYPDQVWKWAIHEFPIDHRDTSSERCADDVIGKEIIDLTEELGYLIIPGKDHAEFESINNLTGTNGLWGKSLVLKTAEHNNVICASIFSTENSYEKHATAKFWFPVGGSLHFRWLEDKELNQFDAFVQADLYHTKSVNTKEDFTHHKWKIYVTDIFDSDKNNHEDNCNFLQLVFDPESSGKGLGVGDLDSHLGLIKVGLDPTVKRFKTLYKSDILNVVRREIGVTKRSMYIVLFDDRYEDTFLACAKLRVTPPRLAKAIINTNGIKGSIDFKQRSIFDPTWSNFQLGTADEEYESNLRFVSSMTGYHIRELPARSSVADWQNRCNTTGGVFNPHRIEDNVIPPAGLGTQEQYPIGDLLGKYKDHTEYLNHKYLLPGLANELSGAYWDAFLPLHGRDSVVHRALVLERRDQPSICATIHLYDWDTQYQTRMRTAEAVFRYPLVGRVLFRQPQEAPWEDTTVIVENLIHADGSTINNTFSHRWAIHERAPGKDFYNWTARCVSAGKLYQPYDMLVDSRHPDTDCTPRTEELCRYGDFTSRHGTLSVAGKKANSAMTRRLFTDSNLALSGRNSLLRKSLVIYDDHGPVARGERMACSVVNGVSRRKAVIKDWFGNGHPSEVKGDVELTQQTEYDLTNVAVTFDRLDMDISNYQIHQAPILKDLEFPCERTTLYVTYDPYSIGKTPVPPPLKGTPDQYQLGDLGGRYGLLDGYKSYETTFNETQMSLFGPYSVLGRSLVLHKKDKQSRSRPHVCSSVARGYSPSESRELRAIASFHHPGGFASGYVRFTQLIDNEGGASDTIIEVNLRYPGERDSNLTHHHRWEVWVNPVGVDAAVSVAATRCVAAGYRWNPYYTQLADPLNHDLYHQECGPDNPLRCHVGDLTSRLGTISVGGDRQMFVDSNLPLEGVGSVLGRSLIVFDRERSGERFACANIEPDKDIIKYVNVMKPPRFVLGQFLSDVRRVLGVPSWMLSTDSRHTRSLHGGTCLQLALHFTGPHANTMELDFTKLLSSGRLDSPSIFIPGFVDSKRKRTISYRQCGTTDPNEKKKSSFFFGKSSATRTMSVTALWILLTHYIRLILS